MEISSIKKKLDKYDKALSTIKETNDKKLINIMSEIEKLQNQINLLQNQNNLHLIKIQNY